MACCRGNVSTLYAKLPRLAKRFILRCDVHWVDTHVCVRCETPKKMLLSEIEIGVYSLHGIGNIYNDIERSIVQLA